MFSNGITMEHGSELVAEGRLIHETAYPQRAGKYTEIILQEGVIDFYDAQKKEIHEIKKSDKIDRAHIAQVKYYIYLLRRIGIDGAAGVIEYPALRKTERVTLEPGEEEMIEDWKKDIKTMVSGPCPGTIKRSLCKNCSYLELCYS